MTSRGRRVVVTGTGVFSPLGDDVGRAFERAFAGESAVSSVDLGEYNGPREVLVAPLPPDLERRVEAKPRSMARASRMAVLAAEAALREAGLLDEPDLLRDAGAYVGCGLGGAEVLDDHMRRFVGLDQRRIQAATVPKVMANGPAAHVSMTYGLHGPQVAHSIACASSSVAIGEAMRAIRHGYLDRAVVGGAEGQGTLAVLAAWKALRVTAQPHDSGVERSCRPFDAERTGLVVADGAAMLVLEAEEAARARGARPLAEVAGFGVSSDAHRLTEPLAEGQAAAIRSALADAGSLDLPIDYINAHATGTIAGDPIEISAIRQALGPRADKVAISSTKAVHGHLIAGAGAIEATLTIRALVEGRIPPTAHLDHPDPDCDLDCVPRTGRSAPHLEWALSNSFAFGGMNAVLALRRLD
jgi:3-oxoacyl-[acyl-carrier-protein] synthase II